MRLLKAGKERVTQAGLAASPPDDAWDFQFQELVFSGLKLWQKTISSGFNFL